MQILLVHGLGRTPISLFGLAAELRKAGHHTQFFGYSPTLEGLQRIVRRLSLRVKHIAARTPSVGLVGHSLGGLLLRLAIRNVPELKVQRLIMLGTPNQSPRMARLAWNWLPFRLLASECGGFLARPKQYLQLGELKVLHTVIAGTKGFYGRLSPFGDEPNDGLVAVSEASIGPGCEVVQLPVWHTTMMDSPLVRKKVVELFKF